MAALGLSRCGDMDVSTAAVGGESVGCDRRRGPTRMPATRQPGVTETPAAARPQRSRTLCYDGVAGASRMRMSPAHDTDASVSGDSSSPDACPASLGPTHRSADGDVKGADAADPEKQ